MQQSQINPDKTYQPTGVNGYHILLNGKIIEVVSGKYTEAKMDKIQEVID